MNDKPLIGITPDRGIHPEERGEAAYVVRRNYAEAIAEAGGLPVILPYHPAFARDYVAALDGLLVSGGSFDIPPAWYGSAKTADVTKEDRSRAELALIEAALAVDLPILGICNGMQLLAIALGGTLIDHIPTAVGSTVEHMAASDAETARHPIRLTPNGILHGIVAGDATVVNSVHHQAVRAETAAFRAAAHAPDGVIEAIEVPERRFCLGLQWHPEYRASPVDRAILTAFVGFARDHRSTRS